MDLEDKFELKVVEEIELNTSELERFFIEKPDEIIYITANEKLTGMITFGDFMRFEFANQELIRRNFTTLHLNEACRALEIFQSNKSINNIPVLDEEEKIKYEIRRINSQAEIIEEDNKFEILDEVIGQQSLAEILEVFSCSGIKEICFIEENEGLRKIFNKIAYIFDCAGFSCSSIKSWEVSKYCRDEWKDKRHDLIVIDFGAACYYYRLQLYSKYHIQYFGYDEFKDCIIINPMGTHCQESFMQSITMLTELYDTIAVYGENVIVDQLIKNGGNRITKINDIDLIYDYNKKEYKLNITETNPEIFVSCNFLIRKCYVETEKGRILHCPFNSLYLPILSMAEHDIVMNIYFKLIKNNVKVLLLKSPNDVQELNRNSKCYDVLEKRKKKYSLNVNTSSSVMRLNEYKTVLHYGEDADIFIKECLQLKNSLQKGFPSRADFKGEFINVYNCERYTEGSIKNQDLSKVYLFGPCTVFGGMVKDEDTIASKLQILLDGQYCVRNFGFHFGWKNFQIRECEYDAGDIVVIMVENEERIYDTYDLPVYSIMEAYNNIGNIENNVWETPTHCNHIVTESIAHVIFKLLRDKGFTNKTISGNQKEKFTFKKINTQEKLPVKLPQQLEQWLNSSKRFVFEMEGGGTGCIVMNCNPFTKGHKYLIEQSAKQVEHLYIFVVEEDKSFFKFKHRLEMVRQGVRELDNVTVLPSGSYMISALTLPGYFDKENLQDFVLDAAEDLDIFADYIAPAFQIKVRFAGEEPNDRFTLQYNNAMSQKLPKRGIEFVEIPRIESDGKPISATNVRKYLKEGDYERLKRLVPDTTYFYLLEHYSHDQEG